MNEDLDLTKILEGCPSGTKFYSTIYGEVCFVGLSTYGYYPIELIGCTKPFKMSTNVYTTKEGLDKYNYNGECTLFPSKEQRDWSKFERFWDKPKVERFDVNTLQPFDKVLARDYVSGRWSIDFFSYKKGGDCIRGLVYNWYQAIPYNEETKHLLGTTDDCPEYYKWWEE